MEPEERTTGSEFGTLLRRHRLATGLSQEALAERARMSVNGVSALERGYRRAPTRQTLALLAGALALNDEQRGEFELAAARPASPRRRGSVTVGPWADDDSVALPLALTSFIGRERELAEIAALVRAHRLVTVTGAGGIGKTQTALRVAEGLDGAYDGALRFIGVARFIAPRCGDRVGTEHTSRAQEDAARNPDRISQASKDPSDFRQLRARHHGGRKRRR